MNVFYVKVVRPVLLSFFLLIFEESHTYGLFYCSNMNQTRDHCTSVVTILIVTTLTTCLVTEQVCKHG